MKKQETTRHINKIENQLTEIKKFSHLRKGVIRDNSYTAERK